MRTRRINPLIGLLGAVLLILASTGFAFTSAGRRTAFAMYVNGQQVGVLPTAARGLVYFDQVMASVEQSAGGRVQIRGDVRFREVTAIQQAMTSEQTLVATIEKALEIRYEAYAILIGSQHAAYVRTFQEGAQALQALMATYAELAASSLAEIHIQQPTNILLEWVPSESISTGVQALEILKALAASNQLVVTTTERISETASIPFETEIREDRTLAQGGTRVLQQGRSGRRERIYSVTRHNGTETDRILLTDTIIREPVVHIKVRGTRAPAPAAATTTSRGTARGSEIVAFAREHLGKPYRYGSAGPDAFDCSGFTTYVFRHFGISLPRTSAGQGSAGRAVSKSDLMIGDLVLFKTSPRDSRIGHVGIYIGGGNFIHAASGSSRSIQIDALNSDFYLSVYVTARRVLS
jgi:cell wall-associated NlpC family hydrolase